jgi:hypothetical protein
VGEEIFSTLIWCDETETLGIVKPLDGTCCHNNLSHVCGMNLASMEIVSWSRRDLSSR